MCIYIYIMMFRDRFSHPLVPSSPRKKVTRCVGGLKVGRSACMAVCRSRPPKCWRNRVSTDDVIAPTW